MIVRARLHSCLRGGHAGHAVRLLQPTAPPPAPPGIKTGIGQHALYTSQTSRSNSEIMSRDPADKFPGSSSPVTPAFTKALPKIELHAHLSGSISRLCLHEIWQQRRLSDPACSLPDPLIEMPLDKCDYDIKSFFPIFSRHIYKLCSSLSSIQYSTRAVLQAFEDDGIKYLELRTTPRAIPAESISKEEYVRTILGAIRDFAQEKNNFSKDGAEGGGVDSQQPTDPSPRVYLLLSIDRRNTRSEAIDVVDLALRYRHYRGHPAVLGIDLCGDPFTGDVSVFRDAFALARQHGLKTTIHFAEVPASASRTELETLLSFQPDRLGHVIHVPEDLRAEIARRGLGLELCLSCNILANMTEGGFADHHFGYWREKGGHIVLGTDDVGVFGSPLSNEYLLAAQHFGLAHKDLLQLSLDATRDIFGPDHMRDILRAEIRKFGSSIGVLGGEDPQRTE